MTNDVVSATDPSPTIDSWAVLHLFWEIDQHADANAIEFAIKDCQASGNQVITIALFGHKADFGVMALGPNELALRILQTGISRAGCSLRYSYVSRTEISEYAAGMPAEMKIARMNPQLPPADMPAYCFYPMSKRRQGEDNWYRLSFDERRTLMMGHGAVGRTFAGRILQVITGSTGFDEFEWGVTLFAKSPDDLKSCVYEMRFDEGSARYAEFGPFVYGTVGTLGQVLGTLGVI